jgi:hypothetical protein
MICKNSDDVSLSIYADWLTDEGEDVKADTVRLDIEDGPSAGWCWQWRHGGVGGGVGGVSVGSVSGVGGGSVGSVSGGDVGDVGSVGSGSVSGGIVGRVGSNGCGDVVGGGIVGGVGRGRGEHR